MKSRFLQSWKSISIVLLATILMILPAIIPFQSSPVAPSNISSNDSFVNKLHPQILNAMFENPNKDIQVIVAKKPEADLEQQLQGVATVIANWEFINAIAVEINISNVAKLAKLTDVNFIVLNQRTESSKKNSKDSSTDDKSNVVDHTSLVNAYNYAIKADKVWDKGYDGKGVTVAVVDSGIKESSKSDFSGRIIATEKFNSTTDNASDKFGHGSHVSGIIGGDGRESGGKYIGVAPGVNLINVKFSDDNGTASEADLVNALQWVYENRETYNIRVVNISSNVGAKQSYMASAVAAAVEQLWFGGVVVVVSAGNRGGENCSTCYAPANDPYVITVGAVDDNGTKTLEDDYAKSWSSEGNTLDGHFKPDIVAPGTGVISYLPGGSLRDLAPDRVIDDVYFKMSGTSMSAPMVSGVVALMLQANPQLTPDQVKWILMNTTRDYLNQPDGSPGIVAADSAVFYDTSKSVPSANRGLTPSPFLNSSTLTIMYSNMSWSNMSWSNMSWSNSNDY
jgi:serine protease AprX